MVGAGQVKVIDFALAMEEDDSFSRHLLRRLRERRRPGTWSYMAPEQIQNKRVTGLTDMYSLGVTLYEVITGRLPFVADTPQALMESHLYGAIPSLRILRPDTPPGLDELVRTMMAKEPLDRPASMQYVSAKLKALAAEDAMAK
jgi:eukaryotic-like serine/threonine-protein kinase